MSRTPSAPLRAASNEASGLQEEEDLEPTFVKSSPLNVKDAFEPSPTLTTSSTDSLSDASARERRLSDDNDMDLETIRPGTQEHFDLHAHFAKRLLLRKTSTEHTIVKDGEVAATQMAVDNPQKELPATPGNALLTNGTVNASISKLQARLASQLHIHTGGDSRGSLSAPGTAGGLDSPTALQERLQYLKGKMGETTSSGASIIGRATISGYSGGSSGHLDQGKGPIAVRQKTLPMRPDSGAQGSGRSSLAMSAIESQAGSTLYTTAASPITPLTTLRSQPSDPSEKPKMRSEVLRSSQSAQGEATGPSSPTDDLPAFQFSPLAIRWPSGGMFPETSAANTTAIPQQLPPALPALYSVPLMPVAHVRTQGTTPVFLYLEDDSCSMYTVPPNTTVNEVRAEALTKMGFVELVESYRVFWMDTGGNGALQEMRIDPNTPVDNLTPPAPSTLKLRLRRKSEVKWSIPVVVDERVGRTRWVLVESHTTVEEVVKVLMTIEVKDEGEDWRLCRDGGSSVTVMAAEDTPFVLWSRTDKYLFRNAHHQRRGKLAGLLGLPSSTDMLALQSQETDVAQDAKRRSEALKSQKLSYILGIDAASPISAALAGSNAAGARRTSAAALLGLAGMKKREKKDPEINSSKEEVEDADKRLSAPTSVASRRMSALSTNSGETGSGRSSGQSSSEVLPTQVSAANSAPLSPVRGSNGVELPAAKRGLRLAGKRSTGSNDTFRHSVAYDRSSPKQTASVTEEDAESGPTQEREKRAGKLADFFGVANKKQADQLHGIIRHQPINYGKAEKNASQKMSDSSEGSHYLVRIYFGNLTYSGVRLSMEATTTHAKGILLSKLMINHSGEQFGLFVHRQDGKEREMTADEKLYDVMLSWTGNECFLFKQRPVRNLLRHKQVHETLSFDSLASLEDRTTAPNARRMAKLAGFFGVDASEKSTSSPLSFNSGGPKREQTELHKIFSVLAASHSAGNGTDPGEPSVRRSFSTSSSTTKYGIGGAVGSTLLYKEGWILGLQTQSRQKSWESNWAKLDNKFLVLRPNLRDEVIVATPIDEDTTGRAPGIVCLEGCTVEPVEASVHKRPFVFSVTEKGWVQSSPAGRLILATFSEAEYTDWVNCIKIAARVRPADPPILEQAKASVSAPALPVAVSTTGERDSVPGREPAGKQHELDKMSMDDFELHRVIGRGKFAKVLLCSRRSTQEVFAIKVLLKKPTSSLHPMDPSSDPGSESRILRSINHPFIVGLHYAFQSPERLYLVMEYINGGELYFHVSHYGRFSEARVQFYCAELLLGLQCLHDKGIIYRDLKLENILLSKEGHVKITDFGLSKQEAEDEQADEEIERMASGSESETEDTIAVVGTLEYLAPEVLLGYPHTAAADIWALGVVAFEMLCGFHPFYSDDREEIQDNILHAEIVFPAYVSVGARSFLSRLLERAPARRMMGADIRRHPFFQGVDWGKILRCEVEVPFKPQLTNDYDVSFFEDEFTEELPSLTPMGSHDVLSQIGQVENFSFRNISALHH